jgi:hypothetical protein
MSAPGTIKPIIIGKTVLYFMAVVIVIFIAVMVFLRFMSSDSEDSPKEERVVSSQYTAFELEIVVQAQNIFEKKKEEGWDFLNGPCLSNNLLGEWVVDVAHNPREAIDDLPENQCTAFITGQVNHFIELDSEGKLIRLK